MNPNQPNEPNDVLQPTTPPSPEASPVANTPQAPQPNPPAYSQPPLTQAGPVVGAVPPNQQNAQPQKQGGAKKVLKIIGIIILGLIILNIAWALLGLAKGVLFGSGSKPTHSNSSKTSASSQYVDSQGRFKITPPAGWQTLTPQAGDLADFQAPSADSAGVTPYINVVSTSVPNTTLDQLVNAVQTSTAGRVQNYKSLGSENVTVSNLPAKLIAYSLTLQGRDLTNSQLIVIKNDGTVFSVTGASSSASWAQNKDTLEKSLLSIQL